MMQSLRPEPWFGETCHYGFEVQELSGLLALAGAAHQQLKDLKWEVGKSKNMT